MKIACLGWGSLIWDLGELPIVGGDDGWHKDGPYLPVEFARQSSRDRLTLVLVPDGPAVQTLWAEMTDDDVSSAREHLADREGTVLRLIGVWPSPDHFAHADAIGDWAAGKV